MIMDLIVIESGSFVSCCSSVPDFLWLALSNFLSEVDIYNNTSNNGEGSSLKYPRVCFVPGSSFMHTLFISNGSLKNQMFSNSS